MDVPNGYKKIGDLFGNPLNPDGTLNHAWEDANIEIVIPPNGWRLYYQNAPNALMSISGIRIHKLLVDIFIPVMQDIWDYAKQQLSKSSSDDEVRSWLHRNRLDQTGGGFNFRNSTGDITKLSLHSYGIAIDWDPANNPHENPLTKTLPDWWYNIWNKYGWSDGRHFHTPDPMHVQFATGA